LVCVSLSVRVAEQLAQALLVKLSNKERELNKLNKNHLTFFFVFKSRGGNITGYVTNEQRGRRIKRH